MLDTNKIIVAAIAIISLAMAFLGGHLYQDRVQSQGSEPVISEKLLADSSEEVLREELVKLAKENEEAKAAIVVLREKLKNQTTMTLQDEADLRLYRRISSMAKKEERGLFVDKVSISKNEKTGEDMLDILLIQSQGRDFLKGVIGVTLQPLAIGSEPITLVDIGSENAAKFKVRFFQTISVPLTDVEVDKAGELQIRVKPATKRPKAFTFTIPWADIEQAQ